MKSLLYLCVILFFFSPSFFITAQVNPSNIFHPANSNSFTNELFTQYPAFANLYADGSQIAGYVCTDNLKFGPGTAKVRFGCASVSETTGQWDCDGIFGMGLEDQTSSVSFRKPLIYSLCDNGSIKPCIFTIILTDTGGEIQLGGYNPNAIIASSLVYAPIQSPCNSDSCYTVAYTVSVQSIRIQNRAGTTSQTIYTQPTTAVNEERALSTIVDSGVSCTILPTAVASGATGANTVSVYQAVRTFALANANPTLFVTINGKEFPMAISNADCYFANSVTNTLVLGDPFFREVVVIHDLTDRPNVRLGYALQNASYTPASGGLVRSAHEIREKRAARGISLDAPAESKDGISSITLWKKEPVQSKRIDNVPVDTPNRNYYYTVVSAGSPEQSPFIIQVDTGSSLTAIFSDDHPSAPAWQVALFSIGVIVAVGGAIGGAIYYYKKKPKNPDSSSATTTSTTPTSATSPAPTAV